MRDEQETTIAIADLGKEGMPVSAFALMTRMMQAIGGDKAVLMEATLLDETDPRPMGYRMFVKGDHPEWVFESGHFKIEWVTT